MRLSAVIRTRDEADRLRLVLASISHQPGLSEVVVVDDGSRDHTPAVLAAAADDTPAPLVVVMHATSRGRSAASNAGAQAATGEVVLFLDGDTLAGPGLAEGHLAAHAAASSPIIGRGEMHHLRCTRYLRDPETPTARPGEEQRLACLPPAEIERMRVTRRQVFEDFAAIERRSEPGIYPGAGPRLLSRLETEALRRGDGAGVLWAAATGSNLSVDRTAFLAVGGFDERFDLNEHRELAFRLCASGCSMHLVEGAASYHLTHRSGWRDPLAETGWEALFFEKHPVMTVKLLSVFWASLAPNTRVPPEARIASLAQLETAALGRGGVDFDAVRRQIGLPALGKAIDAAEPAHAEADRRR